jgi:hypothetical protein
MKRRVSGLAGSLVVLALASVFAAPPPQGTRTAELPARLDNDAFWKLSRDFSEADGWFRSDNLLSNEIWFQYIIPELTSFLKPAGVYLGVGPEQNFTYIAALKPRIVFIFDIRRGNMHTQLMYKALFELSPTRADFVALLFSRERPAGLTAQSSVQEIFSAFARVPASPDRYTANLKKVTDHLTKTRGLPLLPEDLEGIDYVYRHFHRFGPDITYNSSSGGGFGGRGSPTTYATLMTATDGNGVARSYLASEALYGVLKDLHGRNLIVPVVGNFAGPKAIRAVGAYLKERGATVTAFYLSNVEQYLSQDGVWQQFCNNVAALPLTAESTFIYSQGGGGRGGRGLNSYYRSIRDDVKAYGCK